MNYKFKTHVTMLQSLITFVETVGALTFGSLDFKHE
jgi:hypothetical protein